ncbi:MAG: hypothetical protein KA172_10975 [Paludibacter sp.]|nr:hypothetical protein [Paludibacter sp.]
MISKKNIYILFGLCLLLLLGISLTVYFFKNKASKAIVSNCDPVHYANIPITPSNKLNDKNDIHLLNAQKNGLKKPFVTNADFDTQIDDYVRRSILVEVVDNPFYQLKNLTSSRPYLIPEAIDLLNEIGYRFQKQLKEKKYKNYRFRITSLLRTEEDQNKLTHRNSNATGHSAHLYGTTFDISYKDFCRVDNDSIESRYETVQTLTNVLVKMREECKFLAVRERKQSCFHITVVVCRAIK